MLDSADATDGTTEHWKRIDGARAGAPRVRVREWDHPAVSWLGSRDDAPHVEWARLGQGVLHFRGAGPAPDPELMGNHRIEALLAPEQGGWRLLALAAERADDPGSYEGIVVAGASFSYAVRGSLLRLVVATQHAGISGEFDVANPPAPDAALGETPFLAAWRRHVAAQRASGAE